MHRLPGDRDDELEVSHVSACARACVRDKQREREREREKKGREAAERRQREREREMSTYLRSVSMSSATV